MIRSKIRSVGFLIVLIIIIAVVGVGAFVAYYVNQHTGSTTTQNKLDLFKSKVNEMISLAESFYGGSWFAFDNGTFYAIHNGRGGYDVVSINGTTATISQDLFDLFYNKQAFLPYTQSNTPARTGILIVLSNSTKDDKALIMLLGYYWNSVPNPAQEVYEQILRESYSGALTGMRGNNVWMYSGSITGEATIYIEIGQNVIVAVSTAYVNTSLDQLQAFASKAEDLLKSLAS